MGMNLLNHNAVGATIHLEEKELLMLTMLIQEGRISFECDSPTGQALDHLFRQATMLVNRARCRHAQAEAVH